MGPTQPLSVRSRCRGVLRGLVALASVSALALTGSAAAAAGAYTVKPGDTLGRIAALHGVSVAELAAVNGIDDVNLVVVGRTLTIPGPEPATHRVKPGDTLLEIAAAYHVGVADLAVANGIADPRKIRVGTVLTIPSAVPAAAVAPPPAAPAPPPPAPPAAPPTVHVVASGENLIVIAARYRVTAAELARVNGIANPRLLQAGARLTVPVVAPPAPLIDLAPLPARLRAAPERLVLIPNFVRWADQYRVPRDLLMAMAWLESGWQHDVVSSAGAIGIGQLMPDTVEWMRTILIKEPLDPRNPDHNIRMSARYLRFLLDQTGGDAAVSLAGYYQGLRSVRERGALAETLTYVATILTLRDRNF